MSWVLSDPPGHEVGCAQQQSIIKWKWCVCDWVRADPEGTNTSHEDTAQMVSTPATMLLLPNMHLITSWNVPYHQLTKEEKTKAWFTEGSVHYAGTT